MAVLFDNAIALTCSSTGSTWVDIDLSTYVPAGGSIAIIEVVVGTSNNTWGLRQKGSIQNLVDYGSANQHAFSYCGLDSNRVIQGAIGSAGAYTLTFKLHGYLTSDEAVFFPTYYDKTPGIAGSWQSIDCSAQIPANTVFAIFERKGNYTGGPSNLRPAGSTDNRVFYAGTSHRDQIVTLNAGRTLDVYQDSIAGNFLYLKGYITRGTGKVNGLDKTPAAGTYTDINVSADCGGNIAAIIDSYAAAAATATYGLRKKGSTDDFYYIAPTENGSSVVGLDASKIFQAKVISGTSLFVTGYLDLYFRDGVVTLPQFTIASQVQVFQTTSQLSQTLPSFTVSGGTDGGANTLPALTVTGGTSDVVVSLPSLQLKSGAWAVNTLPQFVVSGVQSEWLFAVTVTLPKFSVSGTTEPVQNAAVTLPMFTATGTMPQSTVGEAAVTLPLFSIAANLVEKIAFTTDITLPLFTIDALFGNKAELYLPFFTNSAEAQCGEVMTLAEALPLFTADAALLSGVTATAALSLRLTVRGVRAVGIVAAMDTSLPPLWNTAFAHTGTRKDSALTLPSLTTDIQAYHNVTITGNNLILPRLTC